MLCSAVILCQVYLLNGVKRQLIAKIAYCIADGVCTFMSINVYMYNMSWLKIWVLWGPSLDISVLSCSWHFTLFCSLQRAEAHEEAVLVVRHREAVWSHVSTLTIQTHTVVHEKIAEIKKKKKTGSFWRLEKQTEAKSCICWHGEVTKCLMWTWREMNVSLNIVSYGQTSV